MKSYLLTLIAASLMATLVGFLSPNGEKGGMAKHIKLLTSLFLVCVLIAPLKSAAEGLRSLIDGDWEIPWAESTDKENYQSEMQDAVNSASKSYFTDMLTQTLEQKFAIDTGNIRCTVRWEESAEALSPTQVTVFLSGKAIWKDPKAIESFVSELLGCECTTAIE